MNKNLYVAALLIMIVSMLAGALVSSAIVTAQSSRSQTAAGQASSNMPKWEYEIVLGNPTYVNTSISRLNQLGQQGYEVVGFTATGDQNGNQLFTVLLRRVKQ
ncbi:MAG TPA: hypothetical protein VK747_10685 [Blastocatellia bacterium]|nr:hypothetical protein [Blastocatellia bacterium]